MIYTGSVHDPAEASAVAALQFSSFAAAEPVGERLPSVTPWWKSLPAKIASVIILLAALVTILGYLGLRPPQSGESEKDQAAIEKALKKPDSQSTPFLHATPVTTLVNLTPTPGPTMFGAVSNVIKTGAADSYVVINPISVLMYLAITNTSDKSQTVLGYSLEEHDDAKGNWTPLCNVEFAGHRFMAMRDLHKAYEINTDNTLDVILLGKNLAPSEAVNGWVAFQCPDNTIACGKGLKRIKFLSASGEVYIEEFAAKNDSVMPNVPQADFHVLASVADLTAQKITVQSSCPGFQSFEYAPPN